MKRILCLMAIIIVSIMFSSCAESGPAKLLLDRDIQLADERMEQVFDAVKQENKEDIKVLFSPNAISQVDDMEIQIDQFLSFVQGELESWSREESPYVSESVSSGQRQKQLVTWYTLYTDQQTYELLLVDFPIDTIYPENEGLYSALILKAEDESKWEGTWEDWAKPGMCVLKFE